MNEWMNEWMNEGVLIRYLGKWMTFRRPLGLDLRGGTQWVAGRFRWGPWRVFSDRLRKRLFSIFGGFWEDFWSQNGAQNRFFRGFFRCFFQSWFRQRFFSIFLCFFQIRTLIFVRTASVSWWFSQNRRLRKSGEKSSILTSFSVAKITKKLENFVLKNMFFFSFDFVAYLGFFLPIFARFFTNFQTPWNP